MKTGDLVKQFGVSDQTIRHWVAEFSAYLSDGAKKKGARQSVFNSDDFIILATVQSLSSEGHSFKLIHQKMEEGYRVENISAATVGYDDGRVVPAAAVEQIIDSAELRTELEVIKSERDELRMRVQKLKNVLEETQVENKSLLKELGELRERLGRAEGELSYRRELDSKD